MHPFSHSIFSTFFSQCSVVCVCILFRQLFRAEILEQNFRLFIFCFQKHIRNADVVADVIAVFVHKWIFICFMHSVVVSKTPQNGLQLLYSFCTKQYTRKILIYILLLSFPLSFHSLSPSLSVSLFLFISWIHNEYSFHLKKIHSLTLLNEENISQPQ